MVKYMIRRILGMIPMLFIITIMIFTIAKLAPGDPFSNAEGNPKIRIEALKEKAEMFGANDPLPIQYLTWIGNVVKGDFGLSIKSMRPVEDLIIERLGTTIILMTFALFICLLISIPLGVLAGNKPYSLVDYGGTTASLVGLALPNFYLGLIFIYVFAIQLGWFPSQGSISSGQNLTGVALFLDRLHHLFLPALTIGTGSAAAYFRYMRSEILEVTSKDFIRTARAKGLSKGKVLVTHTLRNALVPIITLLGFELATLVSGAIITENVFSIPGIGTLFLDSIMNRDYPVIMAISLLLAFLVLLGNLIADILYSIADPRIQFD